MADVHGAMPLAERLQLKKTLLENADPFIVALPKVEMHIHIEGIITPAMKWTFSQRNGQTLTNRRTGAAFSSLEELEDYFDFMKQRQGKRMTNEEETALFFEALSGGPELLKTKQDYRDLAMLYFEHAAAAGVRYAEIFFDPQAHTCFGTTWETMMGGFREAQEAAARDLNVKSSWIMCFQRDLSPESAMEHYTAALPYRDMILGIGLDSSEVNRPPNLFNEVFSRARADGFRITAHCDVGTTYPVEHVRQTVFDIGKTGGDRIDHGLNVVDDPALMQSIREKAVGMTVCPWSCMRHQPLDDTFRRIRALFDAGIKISIGCDDPAFMEDTWMLENMLAVQKYCRFSKGEFVKLTRDSVKISWATDEVKQGILDELDEIVKFNGLDRR